ncbi:MAG TPA: tyrosine-type recombinase/integrase [Candidatus Limnocylindrales bacterium]|nr:tyrosine-type recombinase/integrase [Candidatus Limnocylindrales bacterium]
MVERRIRGPSREANDMRRAPDSGKPNRWVPDSGGQLTLGRAVELFLAAKAAEGAAAKTLEWYRMILLRAARSLGHERPLDRLSGPELREWILALRATLAPVSVAGFVRTLKVFGNWLAAEELAEATALRSLRKPRVPDKLVEPVGDDVLRRLLAIASVRDRAILLLLLDTGLRVSEAASLRLRDLRPDGTLKVHGKGAKERIVPVGSTARAAIVRYLGQRGVGAPDEALFLGRRGSLDARGIQQLVRRLKTRVGIAGRLSPALAAPLLRPQLSRQWRRRVQPAADPRPHHARHGEALCRAGRRRSRRPPRGGVAGGPPGRREAVGGRDEWCRVRRNSRAWAITRVSPRA